MSTGKTVLGLVAGIAVGSLLGVLFAPDKGSETRRKISQKGQDDIDTLKSKFNDIVDGITSKFDKVKDKVKDTVEETKK